MPKKTEIKTENKNMGLWNQVCTTNPEITKRVNARGGFTAIDSQAQVQRATELWGPFGQYWGLRDLHYSFVNEGEKVVGIYLVAELYYPSTDCDNAVNKFPIAADMVYKPNDDCFKKLNTECISKALSRLGFNADVFLGLFDDNKYVAEMKEKYSAVIECAELIKKQNPESTGAGGQEGVILRLIYDKYMENCPAGKVVDMSVLRKTIWEKYGVYPTKEASVDKVVSEIPIENVVVDNNFISGID